MYWRAPWPITASSKWRISPKSWSKKRQIIRKDGTLDYFDSEKGLDDVGGLEN